MICETQISFVNDGGMYQYWYWHAAQHCQCCLGAKVGVFGEPTDSVIEQEQSSKLRMASSSALGRSSAPTPEVDLRA